MKSTQKTYSLQDLSFMNESKTRVGILGGTFNPAHSGHIMISKRALDVYGFDYVIWLVANQNPLKPKNDKGIFERAELATKIAAEENRIIVSTAEYDLNTQYIYDSLSGLIKHFPNIEITWMMGVDNVVDFPKWHRSDEIPKLCNIMIFDRPCSARFANLEEFGLKPHANLDNTEVKNIIIDRNDLHDISSTKIRQQQREVEAQ